MHSFTLLLTVMGSSSNVTFVRRHRGTANIGNQSLVFGQQRGNYEPGGGRYWNCCEKTDKERINHAEEIPTKVEKSSNHREKMKTRKEQENDEEPTT